MEHTGCGNYQQSRQRDMSTSRSPVPGEQGGLGSGSLSAAPRASGEEARSRGGTNPREDDFSAAPFKNSALLNQNHLFGFVTVLSSRFVLVVSWLCQPEEAHRESLRIPDVLRGDVSRRGTTGTAGEVSLRSVGQHPGGKLQPDPTAASGHGGAENRASMAAGSCKRGEMGMGDQRQAGSVSKI